MLTVATQREGDIAGGEQPVGVIFLASAKQLDRKTERTSRGEGVGWGVGGDDICVRMR